MKHASDTAAMILGLALFAALFLSWASVPSRAETARNVASIIQGGR